MHVAFAMLRYFPLWALPMAFVSGELGVALKRRGYGVAYALLGGSIVLVVFSILWLIFRGDLNSDKWVRMVLT